MWGAGESLEESFAGVMDISYYLDCGDDFVTYTKTSQMVHKKYAQFIISELCLIKLLKIITTTKFSIHLSSNSGFQTKSEPKRERNNDRYKKF